MVYVLLAEGFEEIEALFPPDILRRGGVDVRTVGVGGRVVCGSHGLPVTADITIEEATEIPELLILPGGLPGSTNLDASPEVDALIARTHAAGSRLAAICAAPFILGKRGLLRGLEATCYPGFEKDFIDAKYRSDLRVVTDGNITTAKGMGVALAFAKELVSLLVGKEAADKISMAICEDINV